MIRVVVDASVAVKWALTFRDHEQDTDKALALLDGFRKGNIAVLEPPHWLAEVAAVVSRESPLTAKQCVETLYSLRIPVINNPGLYTTACELAIAFREHVFDTLYHAAALLASGHTLITADERYYRKAREAGSIMLLRDFGPEMEGEKP